jgi:uncharacterized protein
MAKSILGRSASSEVGADRGLRQGGFAFADMSHRGSLLCLPDAIWAWPVTKTAEIEY